MKLRKFEIRCSCLSYFNLFSVDFHCKKKNSRLELFCEKTILKKLNNIHKIAACNFVKDSIFSRLNDPIYSVKLILIMLTYILLLQLISQSVNPTFCYWGLSLQPNFQKGGLDSIPIFRVGLLGKRG